MTDGRAGQGDPGRRKSQPGSTLVSPEKPVAPAADHDPGLASMVAFVIDDEPANRDFLVRLLQQAKLIVRSAATAKDALALSDASEKVGLIAVDNRLPEMDGIELMRRLHEKHPEARMVMATMLDDRSLMGDAFESGCDVFLVKPHGFMELFKRIQQLLAGGEDTLRALIIDQHGPRPHRK